MSAPETVPLAAEATDLPLPARQRVAASAVPAGEPADAATCQPWLADPTASVEALLRDLLAGRVAPTPGLEASARRLGLDPARPHLAAVIGTAELAADLAADPDRPALAAWRLGRAALDALDGEGWLVRGLGPALVLVAPLLGEPKETHERLGRHLRMAVRRFAGPGVPAVGLGTSRPGLGGIVASYREARFALALGPALGLPPPVDFGRLGFYQLLVPWREPGDLARFRDGVLGPLLRPGRRGRALLDTLAAYLACDGQAGAAAACLGIHRNTLAYRLGRARRLTGLDARRQEERFLLQGALKVHRLLEGGPTAYATQPDAGWSHGE